MDEKQDAQDRGRDPVDVESTGDKNLDKRLATGVLQGDRGTETAQIWISAFLVAVAGFFVYLSSFSIPLHGEDLRLLRESTALHRLVTMPEAMGQMPTAPLSALGLAFACVVGGGRVDAIHAIALLLHLCCAVLVYLIARRLLPKGSPEVVAMLAGLVFVAHPGVVQAVAYLHHFSVLQSSFFGLAALLFLLQGASRPGFSAWNLAAAILSFALACGSDTAALLLPVLGIGLLQFRVGGEPANKEFVRAAVPALIVLLAGLWVACSAAGLLDAGVVAAGGLARATSFLSLCGKVVTAALVPAGQSVLPAPGSALLGGVLAVLAVGGIAAGTRGFGILAVAGFWVLIAAFGSACYGAADAVASMRYVYLPLAGLAILLPWGLQQIRPDFAFRIAGGVAALLVFVLGFLAFRQVNVWRDPATLWLTEADRHPESVEPLLELGNYQLAEAESAAGNPEAQKPFHTAAAATFRKVLDRDPDQPEAQKFLGMTSCELGEFAEARPLLAKAAAREPENQEIALYQGILNEQLARTDGGQEAMINALRAFHRAARLGALPPEAKVRFGMLACTMGDLETGIPLLQDAVGDSENNPVADTLKRFQSMAEQLQTLRQRSDTLLKDHPDSAEGLALRAERLLAEGHTLSAFYLLQFVLDGAPDQDGIWALLGYTSARMSSADQFLAERGESRAGKLPAWDQLTVRTAAGGLWDAAERYMRFGIQKSGATDLPEVKLGEIAMQLRQAPQATTFFEAAQKAYPDRPEPWLRLADMAIAAGENLKASALIEGAASRGAPPEEVKALRDKLGETSTPSSTIERTVIR